MYDGANKDETTVSNLTKSLTKLTFVGFSAVIAILALAPFAEAAPAAFNQNLAEAQQIAAAELNNIHLGGAVYAWEIAGPHDRTPHYCSDECACLANKFAPALKAAGFEVRTLVLHPGKTSAGIQLRGAPAGLFGPSIYAYHEVTAIHSNGVWYALDPVIVHSAKFEPWRIWKTRVQSQVSYELRSY